MLNVFTLKNGRLVQQEIGDPQILAGLQPVWVDLESADPRELGWVEARFGLTIPADVLDQDLEESAVLRGGGRQPAASAFRLSHQR